MKRLAAVWFVALALAGVGVGTGIAATYYGYTAPGAWFPAGAGAGSAYDSFCGPWVENTFSKAWSSYGLITFIDTGGGWNLSKQGYGPLTRSISISESRTWRKKLHCKNNSSSAYQGGCFGIREWDSGCA
ncbi:MAG TPA: hypothetical protein VK926_09705 [Gaiellaceae bacterium]|nr:hypothetical protein [Gaiellaceae bacterium]